MEPPRSPRSEPNPVAEPREEPTSLCDALDRLLDTGIVARGDIKIRVADVDLLYIRLGLIAAGWEAARRYYEGMEPDGRPSCGDPARTWDPDEEEGAS